MTRLVLFGGGHAHALVLLKLREFVSKNLDVRLVTPGPLHTYSGMVPGVVAGHYAAADAQIDLGRLARGAGVEMISGQVIGFDPSARRASLANGDTVEYDVASLNLGSLPNYIDVPGAAMHTVAVKPFENFMARWRKLLDGGPKAPRIAIAGAGAGGVELAMAMKFALQRRGTGGEVTLFSARSEFPADVARRIIASLDSLSIDFRHGTSITAVDSGPIVVSSAGREKFDVLFWAAGAAALPLLAKSGLATDERGYLRVDPSLRSISHPDVFAAGDTASHEGGALPKSGVYAVRQGAVLAANLTRVVRGLPMLDFLPQQRSLSIISCGGRYAIASRGGWSAEGRWIWWWKNLLDRRWIAKFS